MGNPRSHFLVGNTVAKKKEQVAGEPDAIRMWDLFRGYEAAYGTYNGETRNASKNKLEIKKTAATVRRPVTAALWQDHLDGKTPLGIIPVNEKGECVWGCIDVDKYDNLDHGKLCDKLNKMRLPLFVCRSKSGGAHIFLFTISPVEAVVMQSKLRDIAAFLGLGGSEIFPKQTRILAEKGDLGSWLNMPYFNEKETTRYAVFPTGRPIPFTKFLEIAYDRGRITPEQLAEIAVVTEDEDFKGGPPCLQTLAQHGFPEGTRNRALFGLGIYAKKRWPDRYAEIIEKFNHDLLKPPLPAAEVTQVIKSLKKKEYNYACNEAPMALHCNAGVCRTRKYGVGNHDVMPVFGNLTKLNTDQPTWFLDVDGGGRLELNTDELQNQILFQRKCMNVLTLMPPKIKQDSWENIVNELMKNAIVIEPPPEANVGGQFWELVEDFCTDRAQAKEWDEILQGKPMYVASENRYYFRLRDLDAFLKRQNFKSYNRTQITSQLEKRDGGHTFKNVKGRGVNLWFVPGIFDQAVEHTVPESIKGSQI